MARLARTRKIPCRLERFSGRRPSSPSKPECDRLLEGGSMASNPYNAIHGARGVPGEYAFLRACSVSTAYASEELVRPPLRHEDRFVRNRYHPF